jgi:hypothetical protein
MISAFYAWKSPPLLHLLFLYPNEFDNRQIKNFLSTVDVRGRVMTYELPAQNPAKISNAGFLQMMKVGECLRLRMHQKRFIIRKC